MNRKSETVRKLAITFFQAKNLEISLDKFFENATRQKYREQIPWERGCIIGCQETIKTQKK
jgi:hypothetical protein